MRIARTSGLSLVALLALPVATRAEDGSGALLYRRHCAACHGAEGRGDGPAAGALCPPPADLSRLVSDQAELMRQIDGRRTIRAHGSAAMPVWGEVLEQSLIGEPHRRRTALLQTQALADHVYRLRASK